MKNSFFIKMPTTWSEIILYFYKEKV